MNFIYKFLFLFFFLIGGFFLSSSCLASNVVDQDSLNGFETTLSFSHFDKGVQTFKPDQTNLSMFSIYELDSLNDCSAHYVSEDCPLATVTLCKGTKDNDDSGYNCENTTFIASTTHRYNCGWNNITFPTKPALEQGQSYFITFQGHSGTCFAEAIAMTTDTRTGISFDELKYFNSDDGGRMTSPSGFKTYYSPDLAEVGFDPYEFGKGGLNDGGIYKDFDTWRMNFIYNPFWDNPHNAPREILQFAYETSLRVHYGTTTDMYLTDSEYLTNMIGNTESMDVVFQKMTNLQNGKYYAKADLYGINTGEVIASSSVYSFWINNLTGSSTTFIFSGFTSYNSDTYDHLCDNIATSTGFWDFDEFRYGFECAGKKLGYYFSTPTAEKINEVNSGLNRMQYVFPFNVFGQIQGVFNYMITASGIISSSTPIVGVPISGILPQIPNASTTYILSNKTMSNVFGNQMWGIIWNGMVYLIYFSVLVYFVMRIFSMARGDQITYIEEKPDNTGDSRDYRPRQKNMLPSKFNALLAKQKR